MCLVMFSYNISKVNAYSDSRLNLTVLEAKYVDCGKIQKVPVKIIDLCNKAINIIQVAVPVVLIIVKGIDLLKAISSQKEDEIKKAQSLFIKRLILAVLIYFVFVIVKLIVSIIGNSDDIWKCTECLFNGVKYCK